MSIMLRARAMAASVRSIARETTGAAHAVRAGGRSGPGSCGRRRGPHRRSAGAARPANPADESGREKPHGVAGR